MKKSILLFYLLILFWISLTFASTTKQTLKELMIEESIKAKSVKEDLWKIILFNNENEENDAFKRLNEEWITSAKSIEDARLDDYITRSELAKMLVLFKSKTINKENKETVIEKNECKDYTDTENIWYEMKWYTKLACEFWIMWIWSDWKTQLEKFNPHKKVTRAELSTVISRLLYWTEYNVIWWDYWVKHLAKLHADWFINNLDYSINETRKNVFIILNRMLLSQENDKKTQ